MGAGPLHKLAVAFLLAVMPAVAFAQSFVVEDIRVDGLRRVSTGTVYNELPITVGDAVTGEDTASAIKALFATGFFDDVRIERDGSTLVVVVVERPSIASIDFSGNDKLETEDLLESLGRVGVAVGRTFDPAVLDRVVQEIRESYFAQGRYSAEIETTVTPLERHRVGIFFEIDEGEVARIRRINIVGNRSFEEGDSPRPLRFHYPDALLLAHRLGSLFEAEGGRRPRAPSDALPRPGLRQFRDRFHPGLRHSRQAVHLHHDQRDRGEDGSRSAPSSWPATWWSGPKSSCPWWRFARATSSIAAMWRRPLRTSGRVWGTRANAFANVNPVPEIREDEGQVDLAFFVDPGQRVYVRRIEFRGNHQTRDEVLRREMRQLEGAWGGQPGSRSFAAAASSARPLQRSPPRDPARARDFRPGGRHRPHHRAGVRSAAPQRRLRAGPGRAHQRGRHPGEPVRDRQRGVPDVQQQQQPEGVRDFVHQSLLPARGDQPPAFRALRTDRRSRAGHLGLLHGRYRGRRELRHSVHRVRPLPPGALRRADPTSCRA